MNNKHTKRQLFWTTMTVLSIGTLGGCDYCIPAMIAMFTTGVIYTAIHNLGKSLEIQPLA